MGMTKLIFVDLEWKSMASITEMFYSLSRCCQQSSILQAIHLSFNKTTLHLIVQGTPLNSYSKKRQTSLVLIPGHQTVQTWSQWIIRSRVLCSRVFECHMNSVDELKQRLVEVWNSLQQNVIDASINEWRKWLRAWVCVDGQHFEHLLWSRVTDKSYGQMKYK